MDLHVVGGFLGSGKTTAIIGAAKELMRRGKKVGIITNDQGKYLVDTAFFRAENIPTMEVTGGCFCCNFHEFHDNFHRLQEKINPDAVFAESVGSCADIVATVMKPLREYHSGDLDGKSLSVFTDIRLFNRRLRGESLPYSDSVLYIFDKQIEEAGCLIINKKDLLPEAELDRIGTLARMKFPEKSIRFQCSLNGADILEWLNSLESGDVSFPEYSLDIDYTRYGAGEAELAWLNEEISVKAGSSTGNALIAVMEGIVKAINSKGFVIGHVKFFVSNIAREIKVSFPMLPDEDWKLSLPLMTEHEAGLLINARVETGAGMLRDVIGDAIEGAIRNIGGEYAVRSLEFFHPGFPNPTYRM